MKGANNRGFVAYIGAGSNMGDRRKNLSAALEAMDRSREIKLLKTSSVSNTKPVDNPNQPDFLNQVVSIDTSLSPHELLSELQRIENAMGRKRITWKGPRIIDLDILLYGGIILKSPDLTIPHPELLNRSFLIHQIMEIDPDTVDPTSRRFLSSFIDERGNSVTQRPGDTHNDQER